MAGRSCCLILISIESHGQRDIPVNISISYADHESQVFLTFSLGSQLCVNWEIWAAMIK